MPINPQKWEALNAHGTGSQRSLTFTAVLRLDFDIYSPIPTIEDELTLLWRGFVLEPGGSGARRCGVLGMSHLKLKFNDAIGLIGEAKDLTLEQKSVSQANYKTFAVVSLHVDFGPTVWEIRYSLDASVMMYLWVDQAEECCQVISAMAWAKSRFCKTCWSRRPLTVSSEYLMTAHGVESPVPGVPFGSCDCQA